MRKNTWKKYLKIEIRKKWLISILVYVDILLEIPLFT